MTVLDLGQQRQRIVGCHENEGLPRTERSDHTEHRGMANAVRDQSGVELGPFGVRFTAATVGGAFGDGEFSHGTDFISMPICKYHGPMSGPQSTTALSATRRQILQRVADLGDSPATLTEVHGDSRRHPNATRQILAILVTSGHLESAPLPSGGRGRPPLGWRCTTKGWATLSEVDAANTAMTVVASYLIDHHRGPSAHELGVEWSKAHTDLIPELPGGCDQHAKVDGLVTVLEALGFDPVHRSTESGDRVTLHSCPLVGAARTRPDVVCEMHRGFLDEVVHKLGVSEGLTLVPFADEHSCHVELADPPPHHPS